MSAFPTAGSQIYYNEVGEPLGWDYPGDDASRYDDWYDDDRWDYYEPDNPCDFCGHEMTPDDEVEVIRRDTNGDHLPSKYLHVGCAEIAPHGPHDVEAIRLSTGDTIEEYA